MDESYMEQGGYLAMPAAFVAFWVAWAYLALHFGLWGIIGGWIPAVLVAGAVLYVVGMAWPLFAALFFLALIGGAGWAIWAFWLSHAACGPAVCGH